MKRQIIQTHSALLTGISQDEKDFLKAKSCLLLVEIDSDHFSGEKLRSILSMVSWYFKKCTIAIYTPFLEYNTDHQNISSAKEIYRKLADEWLRQNHNVIQEALKIPHRMIKTDEWLEDKRFDDKLKKVRSLYDANESYKATIDKVVHESRGTQESFFELAATELLFLDAKHDYILYTRPRSEAVATTLALIEAKKSKIFLRPVIIEFGDLDETFLELDTETLNQIMNTSEGHIYWKNRNGVILGCNLKQAQTLGFQDIDSLVGKSDFDLLDYDQALTIRKNDLQVMSSGKTCITEESFKHLDKTYTLFSHKSPLRDSKGRIEGIFGFSIDITKQKELLDELNVTQSDKPYVASIINLPESEKDFLKSKSCMVMISVGSEAHEGEKLRATLKMINANFKECTIAVCDTLQRHTLAISHHNKNVDELYHLSKHLGDKWIERHKQKMQEELKIPYRIIRWDHWFDTAKFKADLKKVNELYDTNPTYHSAIQSTLSEFVQRYSKRFVDIDKNAAANHSLKYLLEEAACMLQWFDESCDYEVYYAPRIKALSATFSILESKRCNKLLRPAVIAFDKCAGNQDLNFDKITLDSIIANSPGHIYLKDKHGVYLGCNLSQAQNFNFQDTHSILGKSDFDLMDYTQASSIRKNDLEVMRSGKTQIVEEEAEFLGKKAIFISHKTPLRDHNSAVVGILGVSLDITKQKDVEQQLFEKNKQLVAAMQAKRTFLNNISHEIRTPLSSMLRISHMLYDDWEKYPNNDSRKAHLKLVVEANERLKGVMLDLLDVSKAEAGKMQYNMNSHSLKESVQNVIDEFMPQKHRIHAHYDNGVNFNMVYDCFRIEQVIRNLLSNAINYGGNNDITITLSEREGFIIFSIKDSGVGVPEDQLESIFDRFTQSTRTEGSGGTGLGLSIAKTIVEDHKGFIWAKNNRDSMGSNFSFKLPIMNLTKLDDKIAINEDIEHSLDKTEPLTKLASKKPLLLVIDDDDSILLVSRLMLERMGFEVMTVSSGTESLEILQSNHEVIDVVLLDMMMPDMHGLDVLRQIKLDSNLSKIPIYIHSGISSKEEMAEAINLGAEDFIDKTLSHDKVASILAQFLKNAPHMQHV